MRTYSNRYRPVGLGTIPRGLQWSWVEVPSNYGRPSDLPTSSRVYGVYTTERPLTPAELRDYEIDVIVDAEQACAAARAAANAAYVAACDAAKATYDAACVAARAARAAARDAANAADAAAAAADAYYAALDALLAARDAERANV